MGNYLIYNAFLPLGIALGLSIAFTYLVRLTALKLNWVSIPREDRWNARKVALMGGVAVFLTFSLAYSALGGIEYPEIWAGGALMFAIGFWDDRFELKPIAKFLIQFLAASILVSNGYTVGSEWPFWVAIPFTYLWIIGTTNAFNLLDNMDGLMGGIAVISSLAIGALALKMGEPGVAVSAFILTGAAGGFLVFNYNPAKIFLGDCGSLFVGYMVAALPLVLEPAFSAIHPLYTLAVLVSLTIIPFFDTTLVTSIRLFKGRSPSQGGLDHTSHRMVFSGLSETATVKALYCIALFFAAIVVLLHPNYVNLFYNLFIIGGVALIFFGVYLSKLDLYENDDLSPLEAMVDSIPMYFKRKIQLGLIVSDIVLIIVSLMLSHFVRFEGWNAEIEQAVIDVLPGIIVLKIFLMAATGVYKSVWRYAGVYDSMRIFYGTFLGSGAAGIFAWVYMGGYISVSVFAIDWFLFMFLVASSRLGFKGLRRLFAVPQNDGRNALLYGAGDGGWLALSEIRQNSHLNLNLVGFIDDSPYKQNGMIQGLDVLGTSNELVDICREHDVDIVLICIRDLPVERHNLVRNICDDLSIKCKKIIPAFDILDAPEEMGDEILEFTA